MAVQERWTDLPTVSTAMMTDIINVVQGYVSPSSLGNSVQETLQQVYNLFQSNIILYNAGNPNGAVAGTTYQLCWDTSNLILYVCTVSGTSSSAVWTKSIALTAGTGISISQSGNNITISAAASGLSWNTVTTATQAMSIDNAYIVNYSGGLCTLTLPSTSVVGTEIYILGQSSGGWSIAQNAGQHIQIGSLSSTVGAGGSVSSTNQFDSIQIACVVADTTWQVTSGPQGNLTIV